MPNTELLLELKAWVRSEWEKKQSGLSSEWDQHAWARSTECGTVCCVAGKAALLKGWTPQFISNGYKLTSTFTKDGSFADAGEIARDALDISEDDAELLFDFSNTVEDIEELIDELVAINTDRKDVR